MKSQIFPKPIRQRIILLCDPQKYIKHALIVNIKWVVEFLRDFISGGRLLLWAAYNGYLDIVQSLPNIVMTRDFSEIKCAGINGHLQIVEYLCGKLPNTTLFLQFGFVELLTDASINGQLKIVEFLLNFAVKHSHFYIVREQKIQKKAIDLIIDTAIARGHLNIIKYAINRYAEEHNEKYTFNPNSIKLACMKGHVNIIEYFRSINLQFDLMDPECIIHAFINNQNSMVKYLLTRGVDINNISYERVEEIDKAFNLQEYQYYKLLLSFRTSLTEF